MGGPVMRYMAEFPKTPKMPATPKVVEPALTVTLYAALDPIAVAYMAQQPWFPPQPLPAQPSVQMPVFTTTKQPVPAEVLARLMVALRVKADAMKNTGATDYDEVWGLGYEAALRDALSLVGEHMAKYVLGEKP
jgi:hypothetical protein